MKIQSKAVFYADETISDGIVIFSGDGDVYGDVAGVVVSKVIDFTDVTNISTGQDADENFLMILELTAKKVEINLDKVTNQVTWENDADGLQVAIHDVLSWKKKSSVGTISLVAGHNCVAGDVGYINPDGKFNLVSTDSEGNCPYVLFACTAPVLENETGGYIKSGVIELSEENFTVGGLIYASTVGNSGESLTQTAPSASGNVVAAVGVALTATKMYFFGCTIPVVLA